MGHIRRYVRDLSNAHTDRVSFPFDNFSFSALKPLNPAYPAKLETVGDHLRKRRLDLGLWQKQVAEQIGVTTCTITNWELNRTEPEIRYYPPIIDFLSYVPFEVGESFPDMNPRSCCRFEKHGGGRHRPDVHTVKLKPTDQERKFDRPIRAPIQKASGEKFMPLA